MPQTLRLDFRQNSGSYLRPNNCHGQDPNGHAYDPIVMPMTIGSQSPFPILIIYGIVVSEFVRYFNHIPLQYRYVTDTAVYRNTNTEYGQGYRNEILQTARGCLVVASNWFRVYVFGGWILYLGFKICILLLWSSLIWDFSL